MIDSMDTLTIMVSLDEREAHGLRDILDWLDIERPADFTADQLNGLERLLEVLGRNQIVNHFMPDDFRPILRLLPPIRDGEWLSLRWRDVPHG